MDLREYLSEEVQAVHKNTTYDLIANIVHDGKPSEGSYRIHVLHHVSSTGRQTSLLFLWRYRRAAPFSVPFRHPDVGILQEIKLSVVSSRHWFSVSTAHWTHLGILK